MGKPSHGTGRALHDNREKQRKRRLELASLPPVRKDKMLVTFFGEEWPFSIFATYASHRLSMHRNYVATHFPYTNADGFLGQVTTKKADLFIVQYVPQEPTGYSWNDVRTFTNDLTQGSLYVITNEASHPFNGVPTCPLTNLDDLIRHMRTRN